MAWPAENECDAVLVARIEEDGVCFTKDSSAGLLSGVLFQKACGWQGIYTVHVPDV